MSGARFGDLALSLQTRRDLSAIKTDAARLTGELASGRRADPARATSGDLGPLSALSRSLTLIDAHANVAAEAAQTAGAMQSVLERVQGIGAALAPALLVVGSAGGVGFAASAGAQARGALDDALGALNTRAGGRSVMAGAATDGMAVVDGAALLAAAGAAAAGQTTADGIVQAVSDWFDNPAGFAAQGYLGAASGSTFSIAPGRNVALDVTAADPAVAGVLKGLVSAALLAEGALAGDPAGQAGLAVAAGTALISADAGLADLRGRVGTAEARIEAGAAGIAAERTALGIRRAEILAADDFDTATALQQVEQRLEMLFTVTARLSRLKLTDFL